MALSTFFIGIELEAKNRNDKCLKTLLIIHGIFSISCFMMPILGIFNSNMAGGNIIGTIVLEYFGVYILCQYAYCHISILETNDSPRPHLEFAGQAGLGRP
jgi:putative Mn2+ efflux pump MntP